jgi:hypothetical protein
MYIGFLNVIFPPYKKLLFRPDAESSDAESSERYSQSVDHPRLFGQPSSSLDHDLDSGGRVAQIPAMSFLSLSSSLASHVISCSGTIRLLLSHLIVIFGNRCSVSFLDSSMITN